MDHYYIVNVEGHDTLIVGAIATRVEDTFELSSAKTGQKIMIVPIDKITEVDQKRAEKFCEERVDDVIMIHSIYCKDRPENYDRPD